MQNRREFLRAAGLTAGAALVSRGFAGAQASGQAAENVSGALLCARMERHMESTWVAR